MLTDSTRLDILHVTGEPQRIHLEAVTWRCPVADRESRRRERTGLVTEADRTAVDRLVRRLEDAWNAMDGDADFVNIRGERFRRGDNVAAGHEMAALYHTLEATRER